jgi:hypothetical protein
VLYIGDAPKNNKLLKEKTDPFVLQEASSVPDAPDSDFHFVGGLKCSSGESSPDPCRIPHPVTTLKKRPALLGRDDIHIERVGGLQTDALLQRFLVCLPERKIHVPRHHDSIHLEIAQRTLAFVMHLVYQGRGVNSESFR